MEQLKNFINFIVKMFNRLVVALKPLARLIKKLVIYIGNLFIALVVAAFQPLVRIARKHPIAFTFTIILHIILAVGLLYSDVGRLEMSDAVSSSQKSAPTKAVTIDVEVIKAERKRLVNLEQQKQDKLANDIKRSEAAKKAQKHAEEHRKSEEKKAKAATKKKELAEAKAKEAVKKKEKEQAKAKEAAKKKELAEAKAKEADKQKALAEEKTREELAKAKKASKKKELAEAKTKEADKQKALAEEKTREAEAKAKAAAKQEQLSETKAKEAEAKAKEAAKQKALAEEKTREELAKAKEAAKKKEIAETKAKEAEKKEAIAAQSAEESRQKKESLDAERIASEEKFEDEQNIRSLINEIQAEEDADRRQVLEDQFNQLKENYIGQIAGKVKKEWRYQGAEDYWGCDVHIIQSEVGEVLAVNVQNCTIDNSDKAFSFKQSIERAVYKSSPLPLAPEKDLFDTDVMFQFRVN